MPFSACCASVNLNIPPPQSLRSHVESFFLQFALASSPQMAAVGAEVVASSVSGLSLEAVEQLSSASLPWCLAGIGS